VIKRFFPEGLTTMKFEIPYFGINLGIDSEAISGLSSEALRQAKVFPPDWKIVRKEVGPRLLQGFTFENGVAFFANEDYLSFAEIPLKDSPATSQLPNIVRAYVNSVSHLTYESITIEMKGHFEITEEDDLLILRSLRNTLWTRLGDLSSAEMQLVYEFEDCLCELSIMKREFYEGESSINVITFFAEFEHPVEAGSSEEQRHSIDVVLRSVGTDLERYRKMADLVIGKEVL
jgi:hypothetical protein